MIKKQKLELTWIGKENRPKLEPRILLEDPQGRACALRMEPRRLQPEGGEPAQSASGAWANVHV